MIKQLLQNEINSVCGGEEECPNFWGYSKEWVDNVITWSAIPFVSALCKGRAKALNVNIFNVDVDINEIKCETVGIATVYFFRNTFFWLSDKLSGC